MQRTNVQVVGLAAGITTVIMWLLGFFQPDLMAAAPAGLEAGITAIVSVVAGAIMKEDTTVVGQLPPTESG